MASFRLQPEIAPSFARFESISIVGHIDLRLGQCFAQQPNAHRSVLFFGIDQDQLRKNTVLLS